jgi:hypothetical protein
MGAEWVLARAKSFMNDVTAAKVHMHSGTDARNVRKALTRYLPPEVLFKLAGEVDLSGKARGGADAGEAEVDDDDDDDDELSAAEIAADGREMLPVFRPGRTWG